MRDLAPIHLGEHLAEFLEEFSISQTQLAKALNVPQQFVNEIILGKRKITDDIALQFGRLFKTSPYFWMNLQTRYAQELALEQQSGTDPSRQCVQDRNDKSGEFQIFDVLLVARLHARMTKAQVAEKMGVSTSFVTRLESGDGKYSPSLAHFAPVC